MALGPSNEDKVRNAATMFGTGSKQHAAAVKRFPFSRSASSSRSGRSSGS